MSITFGPSEILFALAISMLIPQIRIKIAQFITTYFLVLSIIGYVLSSFYLSSSDIKFFISNRDFLSNILHPSMVLSLLSGCFALIFLRYGGLLASNKNAKFSVVTIAVLAALLSLPNLSGPSEVSSLKLLPIGILASIITGFWQLDSNHGTKWRHISDQTAGWIKEHDPMVRFRLALHIINEMNEMHLLGHETLAPVGDNLRGYLVNKIPDNYFEIINDRSSLFSSEENFRLEFLSNKNLASFLLPSKLDKLENFMNYHHKQKIRRLIIQHINTDRSIIEKLLLERAAFESALSKFKRFGDPKNTMNLLEFHSKKSS